MLDREEESHNSIQFKFKQEKSNLKKIKIPKRKRWLGGSLNFIVGNSTMQYQDVTDKRKKKER